MHYSSTSLFAPFLIKNGKRELIEKRTKKEKEKTSTQPVLAW